MTTHLKQVGLPTSPLDIQPNWNTQSLIDRMYQDKKVSDGKLVFVLVNKIGDSFVKKDVEPEAVFKVLNKIINK